MFLFCFVKGLNTLHLLSERNYKTATKKNHKKATNLPHKESNTLSTVGFSKFLSIALNL